MTPPIHDVEVFLGLPLGGAVCGSWPTTQIYCGTIPNNQVEYFAAHEMFHQFQWSYVPLTLIGAMEPWMESTANWASIHFAQTTHRTGDSVDREASYAGDFFDSPQEGLVSAGGSNGSTLVGNRAYGAVLAAEYLTEYTDDSLVRESFEAINPLTIDALTPIDAALALHGTSLDQVVDGLWWGMYTVCDPSSTYEPFGWCGYISNTPSAGTPVTKRPAHSVVQLSSTPSGTSTFHLFRYGAAFVDFDLGTTAVNSSGTSLVVEFDGDQVSSEDSVTVVSWADTPGGEQCGADQQGYPATTGGRTAFAFQIPTGCRYATLEAVNKRTGSGAAATDFPLRWSSFPTGATIGNGTVTLGVNADGNLGLGLNHDLACRSGQVMSTTDASALRHQGPALRLDPTGTDAIRGEAQCRTLPTQGWSVVDPLQVVDDHPATWSKPGLYYPSSYPVPVVGFTFTDTEATSVVALGENYLLTQHWHPSSIDPRVYQLDVTISQSSTVPIAVGLRSLTYRQVVPLNVNSWNHDTVQMSVSTTDGVTATTNSLYWPWGSGYESSSIDDPLVPLPPTDPKGDGFAFDATVDMPTLVAADPVPQLSLYYGFADSTAEAASLLTQAGTTTRAIAEVHDDYNYVSDTLFDHALLVGLHPNTQP